MQYIFSALLFLHGAIHLMGFINDFKLPGYAEVIYSYPNGDFCYGTFNLANLEYNVKK